LLAILFLKFSLHLGCRMWSVRTEILFGVMWLLMQWEPRTPTALGLIFQTTQVGPSQSQCGISLAATPRTLISTRSGIRRFAVHGGWWNAAFVVLACESIPHSRAQTLSVSIVEDTWNRS
jgi:hypothetical protein